MKKISVFLPVYNEESIIEKNIEIVYNFLRGRYKNFELIVVDDGSTDSTLERVKWMGRRMGRLKLMGFKVGPSRRENLAMSFKNSCGDIIIYMDSDLSTNLDSLHALIEEIDSDVDISIGSRDLKKSRIKRVFLRQLISFFYNNFVKVVFGSRVGDHQCGFKAFRRGVILDLVNDMGYDKTFRRGWFWDAEILIRAQRKGYKICEIPIKWVERRGGSFKIRREIRMIPYLINFWFKFMIK